MAKMASLARTQQEYQQQVTTSRDPEVLRMQSSGFQMYLDVLKGKQTCSRYYRLALRKRCGRLLTYTCADIKDIAMALHHNHASAMRPVDID